MSKSPYSPEFRAMVAQRYLDGEDSYHSLSAEFHVNIATVYDWVARYRKKGIAAFLNHVDNRRYTSELKMKCVKSVINGKLTVSEAAEEYDISSARLLRYWLTAYNSGRELSGYVPKQEIDMAEARRKTTLEERKEIVEFCIQHDRNYKKAADRFDVSYSQVYYWVKKYDANGEEGLIDKRGHRKTDDEVDELERLRRENKRLHRKLEEKERAAELEKKVKEFERM
jgi:transposase-like protein